MASELRRSDALVTRVERCNLDGVGADVVLTRDLATLAGEVGYRLRLTRTDDGTEVHAWVMDLQAHIMRRAAKAAAPKARTRRLRRKEVA